MIDKIKKYLFNKWAFIVGLSLIIFGWIMTMLGKGKNYKRKKIDVEYIKNEKDIEDATDIDTAIESLSE